jgi:nitrile hydratase
MMNSGVNIAVGTPIMWYEMALNQSRSRHYTDAAGHNFQAQDEPTYDVRFPTEDLWPRAADRASVHAGLFDSRLEKAP